MGKMLWKNQILGHPVWLSKQMVSNFFASVVQVHKKVAGKLNMLLKVCEADRSEKHLHSTQELATLYSALEFHGIY